MVVGNCLVTKLDLPLFLQLNNNDPALTELRVRFGRNKFANCVFGIDWKGVNSDVISKNTHLKKLSICCDDDGECENEDVKADEIFRHFCLRLAQNKSIEHLSCKCPLDMETLRPFLENNDNLRHLKFEHINYHQILAAALSNRKNKSSLETIMLCQKSLVENVGYQSVTEVITSLSGYHNLVKLDLNSNKLGVEASVAVGELLKQPNVKIEELDLSSNHIDDDCIATLADGFAKSKTLKKLNLGAQGLGFGFGDRGVIAVADVVAKSATMKSVDLRDNGRITPTGWCAFFNCLRNSSTVVEELNLGGNAIDDESAAALADAFFDSGKLLTLVLDGNGSISVRGWQVIATLLLPSCVSALEVLDVRQKYGDVRMIYRFANALVNNRSLKTLLMGHFLVGFTPMIGRALAVTADTLYNKSSIDATYASNHTLEKFSYSTLSSHVNVFETSLLLNENKNKTEVARHKILKHHIIPMGGPPNLQVFLDMEWKVLPRAIAWMGICRDSMGFSVLHKLLTCLPSLLSNTQVEGIGKRKMKMKMKRRGNNWCSQKNRTRTKRATGS